MAISYIGQTNTTSGGTRGTSLSLTPHGSTQVGDVVIAFFASENNATFTPGSGFTLIKKGALASNVTGLGIYYKVMASSGDITSYTFSCSASSNLTLGMVTVSGIDINYFSVNYDESSSDRYNVAPPTIFSPTTGGMNFLITAADSQGTVTQPSNWTELFDINSSSTGDDSVLAVGMNSSISSGITTPGNITTTANSVTIVASLTLIPSDATFPTDVPYLYGVNLETGAGQPAKITLPPHQADDLLMILATGRANAPIWQNESGWTKVVHYSGEWHSTSNFVQGIYYQIATSSSTPDFFLDVNADDLFVETFVIRNVDVDKFTKGIASSSYEHKLTVSGTVSTEQVNPEFDKSLVIEYIFSGRDGSTFSNANWTNIRYHDQYGTVDGAGQVGIRTLTTNAQVQGYSVTAGGSGYHIHALRFYFAAPGATMYPTLRWIKNETTSPVNFYINEYQRYFWKDGAMVMMIVDHDFDDGSDQGLVTPVANPRHSYGAVSTDSLEVSHGMFMQTYVPATSSLAGATFTYTSSTVTVLRSLYQIVGVDTTNPISDFQSLNFSSDGETGITSASFKAKTLYPGCNHIIMARGNENTITGLQTPSGYTDYKDDNVGLVTFNKVTDPSNISTTVTATGSLDLKNWCSFALNPYGIPSTKKRPTIRSRIIRSSSSKTSQTIYTAPLKAGDVVVFFSATKITTGQITLTSSLGTLTNLYAVNDDTNKWNASIDAIKIASAVTTSWTITSPLDTGSSLKYVVGVVFENTTIENVSSILKASAISSTTVSSHDLTFTDNAAVGYTLVSYAYPGIRNADNSDAGPTTSNYGNYSSGSFYGQTGAFDNPIPTAFTETITYPQGAVKSFLMGVRLSGYGASDAGFFFGTPF